MKKALILLLILYKHTVSGFFRTVLGEGCKYSVSCSQYAILSIDKHGMLRGVKLAGRRLLSCHTLFQS